VWAKLNPKTIPPKVRRIFPGVILNTYYKNENKYKNTLLSDVLFVLSSLGKVVESGVSYLTIFGFIFGLFTRLSTRFLDSYQMNHTLFNDRLTKGDVEWIEYSIEYTRCLLYKSDRNLFMASTCVAQGEMANISCYR
jgi:hypothetical protein